MKIKTQSAIEKYLFTSPTWKEGFREFASCLRHSTALFYFWQDGEQKIIYVNSSGKHLSVHQPPRKEALLVKRLKINFEISGENSKHLENCPKLVEQGAQECSILFALEYLGRFKGYVILFGMIHKRTLLAREIKLFNHFLQAEIALAYRTLELQNFYETVHPRALALSTIHSVHRAMAMSSGLDELLPRVGRLCAQVLKAKRCDVYLFDRDRKFLELKFSLGDRKDRKKRVKSGYGIEGHVGETAEFHLSSNCVCVPFIEDDVVGVVSLREKIDCTAFSRTDMEILKTLTEQAVVAIKNALLFEETERLTVNSIKTINELLELSFSGDNVHLPLFGEITLRIGRDLGLSEDELTNLHRATFLIDAGHLGTPGHILKKSDRLTDVEYEEVKQHPLKGAAILEQIGSLKPVIPTILHHHERYDGNGYPSKLKGEEIPIGGRIVAVVDSFTAMLSKRPYRKILGLEVAIEEIRQNSGSQFDPKVVESFLKVIRDHEIASKIKDIQLRYAQG